MDRSVSRMAPSRGDDERASDARFARIEDAGGDTHRGGERHRTRDGPARATTCVRACDTAPGTRASRVSKTPPHGKSRSHVIRLISRDQAQRETDCLPVRDDIVRSVEMVESLDGKFCDETATITRCCFVMSE